MSEVMLYLPDELAEHVKEHDLPISQSDLDAAVARLSQSKAERDEARFAAGQDVGMKWARDRASIR